ncbi:MAG TPA: bifunctional DNA-formamidopyrimidine glycosylase/DNA-(apurinic or apyrimidinic site) lyase [Solirubrobacteraceae bacterium]|nr:bifunctional DNA-formamidopyrimidine glycosylase/DNA-(apurinic or apyrimidinic site) lyase [Solirubrobacteraceae bacterium]
MPELPEVETIRSGLAARVEGRVLERLDVLDARWTAPLDPRAVADAVQGRRIERLARRGKYLVLEIEGEVFLVMHLRMTGNLLYDPDPATPHQRVVLGLDDGHVLRFCDPRRFGTGELVLGVPAREGFFAARLGIEPLDGGLTGESLRTMARGRRAPVKSFLLDQRRIAGVGNIYANEALFRAGVHPLRAVGSLRRAQYEALARAVGEALRAGLAAGGASIDDFRHPDGLTGSFQDEFLVHGREGEPCVECGRPIRKLVVGGRGTYACERCQPKPRPRRRGRG